MDIEAINAEKVADKLARDITPALTPAMVGLAQLAIGKMSKYPGASEGNSPQNARGRWYQRGYGPRWIRKRDGSTGGRATSENYGRSWSVVPVEAGAVMRSGASYSGAVGRDPKSKGKPKQARIHGRRGWVTDRESVRRVLVGGYMRKVLGNVITKIVS